MLKSLAPLIAATAIAVMGLVRPIAAPTYKPIEQHRFSADDGRRSPTSFDDLWKQSSAVVEGVVERTEPDAAPLLPQSRVTVRIVEVFKGDGRARARGGELYVLMAGAVTDRGAFMESLEDPDAPLLRRNQRPILFLRWGDTARAFQLATGTHDSLFLVDGASIASKGRSALARALSSQSHGQFAARLRALRDGN